MTWFLLETLSKSTIRRTPIHDLTSLKSILKQVLHKTVTQIHSTLTIRTNRVARVLLQSKEFLLESAEANALPCLVLMVQESHLLSSALLLTILHQVAILCSMEKM